MIGNRLQQANGREARSYLLLTAGAVRARSELLASPNHPNIAPIYGVHEADGSHVSLTDALARL